MADASSEVDRLEIALLLEGIFLRYGYDFRDYNRNSVERRLGEFLATSELKTYGGLTSKMLREPLFFHELLNCFSVSVTSLFRSPFFFSALREKVVPLLRSWPHVKIWDAGCATGEEVYSLAILLHEAKTLKRSTIYATDISQPALETAKAGVYSLDVLRQGSENYHNMGGGASLSEYYHARYKAATMKAFLRKGMTFARHNLVMDKSFGEMQMILCRNVLIYFNESLRSHVLELFYESLSYGGYLCLGDKESLSFSNVADRFVMVDRKARIYKKIN